MSERLLCGYFSQVFDAFETDTLMEMMAGFLLVDYCYKISRRDVVQRSDMLILLRPSFRTIPNLMVNRDQ